MSNSSECVNGTSTIEYIMVNSWLEYSLVTKTIHLPKVYWHGRFMQSGGNKAVHKVYILHNISLCTHTKIYSNVSMMTIPENWGNGKLHFLSFTDLHFILFSCIIKHSIYMTAYL